MKKKQTSLNNPEYVKINDKKYKINTDFRVAIECNCIAIDETIGEREKGLAIIYKLFGEEGLDASYDYERLLELGQKYLLLGEDPEKSEDELDMDYVQDRDLIASSFKYDYKYNPYALEYLHWWDFYTDMKNLSNSEFGNCCVLSRVRNLRTYDTSKIKDQKEKQRILKAKERVALKRNKNNVKLTEEEVKIVNNFFEQLKGD